MCHTFIRRAALYFALFVTSQLAILAQSNVTVRIMAANLNGQTQSIQPFEINIFKGLKPDPTMLCNGMLAGLVAITAPVFATTFWATEPIA